MSLNPERDAEIVRRCDSGEDYLSIAEDYAVSTARICQIFCNARRQRGETIDTPIHQISPHIVRNAEMLRLYDDGQTYKAIARHYGLSVTRVSQLIARRKRERLRQQPDPDDGQPDEQQEWRDYDPDC